MLTEPCEESPGGAKSSPRGGASGSAERERELFNNPGERVALKLLFPLSPFLSSRSRE